MNERFARFWPMALVAASSCFQALDTTASNGSPVKPPEPVDPSKLSTVILPGDPPFGFFDDAGALVMSKDPCDATRAQAMTILTNDCAICHGGRTPGERAGLPPFDFVLDVPKLTTTSTNNTTPPMLFVAPGDPDRSRVYQRVRRGEMPPAGETILRRPTVSDVSILYEWISHCIGPKPPPGSTGAGGGPGDDGGSATSAGGSGPTGGGNAGSSGAGGSGGSGGSAMGDGGAPKYIAHTVTFFAWPDNGGDGIAFPKLHMSAGGIGTYDDPITFASDPIEWPPGTILYVPYLQRYVIMEDSCSACTADWSSQKHHINIWLESDARSGADVTACESSLMRTSTNVEVDPPPNRPIATVPLFDPNRSVCVSP